jgi:DNA helicase-2/ATP-dependent DNA helicase PcrA
VLWLSEGRFPTPQSLKTLAGEEEERRLFYVAVTRAKDELYLMQPIFHVERDHSRIILRPSRYIAEIDSAATGRDPYFERWSIEETPADFGVPHTPTLAEVETPAALPPTEATPRLPKGAE